nr:unnamed protein product [Callosobruchus analis]
MRSLIECKKTDAVTWKQKEQAWKKIAEKYNASTSGVNRTDKQLKNKYEAIKKEIKKQHSQYMAYQRGTGGGPYMKPPSPKTDDERVLASTIALSVKGLTSTYDSDVITAQCGMQEVSHSSSIEQEVAEAEVAGIDIDWSDSNCSLLQTEKHALLKPATATELSMDAEKEQEIIIMQTGDQHNVYETPSIKVQALGSTWRSRRRPILAKKKTVSSAGAKFEELAVKKQELVELQLKIAEQQLHQNHMEHEKKMKLLDLQITEQQLKNKLLEKQIL